MGATSKLRKAARRMMMAACGSLSRTSPPLLHPPSPGTSAGTTSAEAKNSSMPKDESEEKANCSNNMTSKTLCAICLEALSSGRDSSPGQAIFTAQCSHSFHFSCISSNVRHGSVTCPICRAHWTQLPRNINPPPCALSCNQNDPVFRILDDSIATFRVHRRSFLRSARYDDDDPIEPDQANNYPCLDFCLVTITPALLSYPYCFHLRHLDAYSSLQMAGTGLDPQYYNLSSPPSSSLFSQPAEGEYLCTAPYKRAAYLSVKLSNPRPTDLVLMASPNGPHLRLLKQSMALVVSFLRPVDRLAIVTYSSAAARVFPLRRMTSCGKRTALQVIDRLFYMGQADPFEGLRKCTKILEDRAYKNPQSCILHLSDSPTRSYHAISVQLPVPVHRFHVGFGVGTSNGLVMREFKEFIGKVLGGVVRDVQLRIGDEAKIIRVGELRGGEERRVLLELGDHMRVCVGYTYVEGGLDEWIRTGETVVTLGHKRETKNDGCGAVGWTDMSVAGGRRSSAETWDYHDPFMARRWAKRLHAYRL